MKKSLKLLALFMAFAMCMTLFTACGEKEATTFKIGGIGPLTDSAAQYGNAVKNAAELAVKEINENGGVNGVKLEFNMQDDVADGEKSVNAYNNLKDWGMQILMGTVTSGACLSVIDLTKQDNMFQLTPSASAKDVVKYDNCFQVCFTDPNQGSASAQYISDNKLATKIAVIYDSSDAYSSGIYDKFMDKAKELKLNVVSEKSFTKDSKTDFSAQISDAKSKGADVIICDTAGRLHNKKNLMDELAKIYRVIGRELPDASIETLLVLDAATGQNAVNQAREFKNVADITGIVLTKLDGTAKGGIVIPIHNELNIPVKYIGVGEGIDDLQPFNAKEFVDGIFQVGAE